MNKIICCVNRTQVDPSILIKQTLRLAQFFESSICFVKIFDKDLESSNEDQSEYWKKLRKEIDGHIGKEHQSIPITCTIAFGDLLRQLNQLIEEESADLLIIGTNREGLWYRYLFGDNSINIAQVISCPVLLIPIVDHEFGIRRIVYSTQLIYDNLKSLSRLKLWAAALHAKVYCIHVYDGKEDLAKAMNKMNDLRTYFGEELFDYQLVEGDLYDSIAQQAYINQFDLIVALHRRLEWWAKILHKSKSKNLYKQLKIPMLFFKE